MKDPVFVYSFQNLLFYYDSEHSAKPIGVIFLEGCFCERVLNPTSGNTSGSGNNTSGGNKGDRCTAEKMVRTFTDDVYLIMSKPMG